jgi:hypothetical protein
MKDPFYFLPLLILVSACTVSIVYLLKRLRKDRELVALVGLFCLTIGIFLLMLDLTLFSFAQGPQYIPDYLLFNWLAADTGFAGRWVLTAYLFISAGIIISIYLLARNLIKKFNEGKTKDI